MGTIWDKTDVVSTLIWSL